MPKKQKQTSGHSQKQAELDELRSQFIRIMSHQLRTPLSVVRWNLETLLEEKLGALNDMQREFLRLTDDNASEIIKRVDNLLTVIEIEQDRVVLRREEIDVVDLFNSACQRARQRSSMKQQKFTYKKPGKVVRANIDPDKVYEIFTGILDDAIEYTSANGSVTATLTCQPKSIRFEVTDTGIGIPKHEQGRIFERFYRGSNAHLMKQDASGVTLSIAKYYTDAHGGKIGCKSTEGIGTTFWVELPTKG